MHTYKHIQVGEELDLSKQYVINCRRRFLNTELELLDTEIAYYRDYEGDDANRGFADQCHKKAEEKRKKVLAELQSLKTAHKPKKGITDEDIDAARNVPITSVIEFVRGKAVAFCHEDRNPSMYHATRLNLAICPVCNKPFDTIAVLMVRDNLKFYDAVKQLLNQ